MTVRSFPQYLLLNVTCKYSLYLHTDTRLYARSHPKQTLRERCRHHGAARMNFRSYHQNHGGRHGSQC
jgi:hypothetical protein